ncbi:MAG TPA: toll/interleukin-1 receptor domain-containing protein [Albitalea sp.]|nr:toll/interleukin-1 receptor domain-containing protein [Albitalea sp.]
MYEIFISYRRDDTKNWAGPLFRDLQANFGDDAVFMDTFPGRIPWGADWQKRLAAALDGCDVLLALIGPHWATCTRSDGRRRLDVDDDWVRREIATALRRGILVLPVVFEGAEPPGQVRLPQELVELGFATWQRNARPITSGPEWKDDIKELVDELVKRPVLKALHDLATATKGIHRLKELIADDRAVHDAVVHSQDAIRSADREIGELKLLKDVHDALHTVEHECLLPLKTDSSNELMFQAQLNFVAPASVARAAARTHGQAFPLLGVLAKRLDFAEAKFADAMSRSDDRAARLAVIEELETMTSRYPDQLQDQIGTTTKRLQLDDLVKLMTTVRKALPGNTARDAELAPLLDAIDELCRMRDRLTRLVREHGCLQSLDMTLRYVCDGLEHARPAPSSKKLEEIVQEWEAIEGQRLELQAPFSQELQDARVDILAMPESRIRAAIKAGDADGGIKLMRMYFQAVGTVFWALDASLKRFCADLDVKSKQMKTVLSQTEVRHE